VKKAAGGNSEKSGSLKKILYELKIALIWRISHFIVTNILAEAKKAENGNTSAPSTPVRSENELSGASKVLEDKLLKLKGQLHDLRSSIKGFEEDFDRRLDQCLAEILGVCCA
jgi:hypothetical protein